MTENFDDAIFRDVIKGNEKKETEKPAETTEKVVVEETKAVATQVEKPKSVVAKKETLEQKLLNQVIKYAETSNTVLSTETKALAVDIISATNNALMANKYVNGWGDIDILGCNLIGQIKRWARIGISSNDHLWIDIRRNKNKDKSDIFIKPQYQTIEKVIVKYFNKDYRVLRFKEDVICIGDEVEVQDDFETGLDKITKHIRNEKIDRNKLDNIIGAYKIIYLYDKINKNNFSILVRIDRNRINRAMNASASEKKEVWNADARKMVLKTVTWEMYNDKNIRPFLVFPEEIANDMSIVEENEEMNWNNDEKKYDNVKQAQNDVKENVASGEVIDMTYED